MPRGKRDINRTRRVLQRLLDGAHLKQIAFEEKMNVDVISALRSKYMDRKLSFTLNNLGLFIMSEEQLSLPLHRESVLRVDHRLRNSSRRSKSRQRPRKLV